MGLSDLGGPNESQWAYEVEKEKIIRYLEILKSRITITTDKWTSNKKKATWLSLYITCMSQLIATSYCKVSYVFFSFFNFLSVFLFDHLMISLCINDMFLYIYIFNVGLFICLLHTQKKFF